MLFISEIGKDLKSGNDIKRSEPNLFMFSIWNTRYVTIIGHGNDNIETKRNVYSLNHANNEKPKNNENTCSNGNTNEA